MHLTAVEILQTSAMDCGPAALASLLASLDQPIDLGRLRAACQTDLDGTSIDTMERVALDNGLRVEQSMLPADRLTDHLPALAVVRLPDGAPHFVTVWRRVAGYVQVMDPARGRYWTRAASFVPTLLRHRLAVPAQDWAEWARQEENLKALGQMADGLGLPSDLIARTAAEPGWFPLSALEACLRLARVVSGGRDPAALALALIDETRAAESDIFRLVPPEFWPVVPDPTLTRAEAPRVILQGAVFLRILRPLPRRATAPRKTAAFRRSPLVAAYFQGALPIYLLMGTLLAVLGTLAEGWTFRRLIDPSGSLPPAIALVAALYVLRLSLGSGILALGRQIEARWRHAFAAKLLRLPDRWLASRPLGDVSERAQSLHLMRAVPGLVLHLAQAGTEVVALAVGLMVLTPDAVLWVLAIGGLGLVWPFLCLPWLRDRDLTLRSLGAAQAGILMDALQGQAALRAHRGGAAVMARYRGLLQDWQAAARARALWAGLATGLGQVLVVALVGGLILTRPHLDLLVLWWLMKLPAAAAELSGLLRQIPAQEAILTRAHEPLAVPDRPFAALPPDLAAASAVAVTLENVHVTAAGHQVLRGVDLSLAEGEAVAVVGASGSGKSSLLGLMLGWHDQTQGRLSFNGCALDAGQRNALSRRIVWLDPTSRLWGRTLAEALPDTRLAKGADLHLPPETPIGAGGVLLSAGEGQRLRLARAFGHDDPALVLCDEALRGLDAPRRQRLLAAARQHWAGRTMVWVTHDLHEALCFDRVVVMAEGRVAEDGNPHQLLAQNGPFAALWHAQEAMEARMARDWQALPIDSFATGGADVQPSA